jgi:arabinofuranosyltransferase
MLHFERSSSEIDSGVRQTTTAVYIAILSLVFAVLIRTAWMSDDAEITLRCVMNFIHGYGPTFNIDERVQAFTHPLWFLLISGFTLLLGNVFAATFILSIVFSLLALWLLMSRLAIGLLPGIVAGVALVLSKAFVDYSTSGLENPLSHLLMVYGLLLGFRFLESERTIRSARACLTILSLIYLCRPDLVLLIFPFYLIVLWQSYETPGATIKELCVALTPELLWTAFSLFYYGSLFPNTGNAKLGTGISLHELIRQGFVYFFDSFSRDPITLTLIFSSLLLALREQSRSLKAIAVGVVLYLIYVLCIGGDFMTGRFLTAPLLASAVILSRSKLSTIEAASIGLILVILGATSLHATILSGPGYADESIPPNGIADERGFMYPMRGLITTTRDFSAQPQWRPGTKSLFVQCVQLGMKSLYAGPDAHFIDSCALTDPLLARLPAKGESGWRIGHFERYIPSGYAESVMKGENLLADSATRDYWEVIRKATRGPLLSFERLIAIVRLNLGLVKKPDFQMYRSGDLPPLTVDLNSLSHEPVMGVEWYNFPNIPFESSIEVRLPFPMQISSIDVSLDGNDKYLIECRTDSVYVRLAEFGPTANHYGMSRYKSVLAQPSPITDKLRITAEAGDEMYAIGHLFLNH